MSEAKRVLMPCQYHDPQRGPFDPQPRNPRQMRVGKTDRDHRSGAHARLLKNRAQRADENRGRAAA